MSQNHKLDITPTDGRGYRLFLLHLRKEFFLIITIILLLHGVSIAQIGLGGIDAIMTVPTARILQDGNVAVGFGYIPKPYAIFLGPDHDNLPYFVTFGFLPFLEISFRATKALKRKEGSMGDRMASIRIQLLTETQNRPALTVGIHDVSAIFRTVEWFHSLYLVSTKSIFILNRLSVEPTIGYGVDWIETRNHEFVGLFGGISLGYRGLIFIKAEYDTKKFNYGLGFDLFGLLSANLAIIDGKKLAFGFNLRRRL